MNVSTKKLIYILWIWWNTFYLVLIKGNYLFIFCQLTVAWIQIPGIVLLLNKKVSGNVSVLYNSCIRFQYPSDIIARCYTVIQQDIDHFM